MTDNTVQVMRCYDPLKVKEMRIVLSLNIVQAGSRSQVAMNVDADEGAVVADISDEGSGSLLKKRRSCRPGRQKLPPCSRK